MTATAPEQREELARLADWMFDTDIGRRSCKAIHAALPALLADAERCAELEAKVAWMERNDPAAIVGWPWDAPYNDGFEAGKEECRGALIDAEAKLKVAVEALEKTAAMQLSTSERRGIMPSWVRVAQEALAKIKETTNG